MQRLRQKLLSGKIKYVDLPRSYGKSQAAAILAGKIAEGVQINTDMDPVIRKNGGVNVTIEPVITDHEKVDEAAEVAAGLADKPVYGHCVICNAPIYEKRHTTCSKKCLQEKARRYAKEYARKHVKTEGVSGEGGSPLPRHGIQM